MEELHIKEKNKPNPKHHSKAFWAELFLGLLGVAAILVIFGTQYATGETGFFAAAEFSASAKNSSDASPAGPFIINFNQPVVPSSVESSFKINPEMKIEFEWTSENRELRVKPAQYFNPGTDYAIWLKPELNFSLNRIFKKNPEEMTFFFRTADAPKVISISPASGDPNVKIDSAIKISFDKSTTGYDVNFVVEPFSSFDLSYDNSRKDFTIAPKAKFEYATDYAVSVKEALARANLPAKEAPEIFRANFKTEPSPPPPPPVQEVVLPEKNSPVVADSQVATTEAKIKDGKYIDINLAKQQLSTFEDGDRLGTYKISSGKRGMATPAGTFRVLSKAGRAYSKKYNLYMPYWMQFTGAGHGIHELPEWKSGYKEGANHLGIPVSHGCVRLGIGPAAKVYGWAEKGTPVVIHY